MSPTTRFQGTTSSRGFFSEDLRYLSLKANKISGDFRRRISRYWSTWTSLATTSQTCFLRSGICSALQHLDLSSNKFSGDVSASLSSCKSLTFLNLTNNQLSGEVPVISGENMQYLYLSGNDFRGKIPGHLSGSLCSRLVELNLSSNNLSGSVPESLGSCSALESLDLSNNNFSGELPINTLLRMVSLKNVSLAFNNFVGSLPDSFSNITNLEALDVSSNRLSGFIPFGVCQNPSNKLKLLYLQNNMFTGPAWGPSRSSARFDDVVEWASWGIPLELMYVVSLENLILDFNELSGTIPASLSNCTNLNWISLSNNKLTGEIPGLVCLIWLDLNTNLLNGTIPPALFKQSGNIALGLLTGKRYIYIKNDGSEQCHGAGNLLEFGGIREEQFRISTRHPCNFTRELGSMYYLSVLNLGHNDLSGPIPQELQGLKMVGILDLSYNRLNGSIPQSLTSLTLLGEIDLSNNNLDGTIPQSAPFDTFPDYRDSQQLLTFKSSLTNPNPLQDWLATNFPCNFTGVSCKNSRISSIDLSYKILDTDFAAVSSYLFSLQNLESLSLKGSNITGSVASVAKTRCSSTLAAVDLAENGLTGPISDLSGFSPCSGLTFLNLSRNFLDFNLKPKDFSNGLALKLRALDVSYNKISGNNVVPWLFSEDLRYLSLKANKISGEFPASDFKVLEYLDLSCNNFTNVFPSFGDCCSALQHLDLSSNKFSGDVSASLSSCKSLTFLNLTNNQLSGEVPVISGENMQYLYLSGNDFRGKIPGHLSGSLCSRLVELNLSSNNLSGSVPESLGSCSALESLDLSNNNFSGELPINTLLRMVSLKNVSLAFNNFVGSLPDSFSNITNLEALDLGVPLEAPRFDDVVEWASWGNPTRAHASFGRLANLAILKLGNNSISGSIPPELGDCWSLIWLDLNTNLLNGTIPPALFKQSGNIALGLLTGKRYIYIKNDGSEQCHGAGNLLEFGGIREEQFRISTRHPCNFTRVYKGITQPTFNHNGSMMILLDLSHNLLDGSIPKELGSMYYLSVLNLGHNDLSGPIPQELQGLKMVGILDLSYNRLNGSIPQSLTSLTLLGEIDLSNNNLDGTIPQSAPFDTFPDYRFLNNSGLCGYPLQACSTHSSSSSNSQHQMSHRRQASLAGSVAMGLLFSLFCIFGLIIVAIETRKRRKKKEAALEAYIENHSHSGTANSAWKLTGAREALSINLATFEKPLRKLTFADLLEATNGFHNDSLIGSGGFGDVYRAQLKDGSIVAIKKLIHISGQGDREFTAEMETIGKIKQQYLVPLLGYCKVGEERLLVYEYMKYGSLEDVLHDRKKIGIKLNWSARRKIAIGAARGLAFLHHNCIPHIIHRDMKSSNVLLDENLEARVSDFGMARLMSAMDTHLSVSTLAGTPGYVPPEYYQSFQCTTKGDVYSYGVVLLELLTGKQPIDSADFGDNNLVGWVKQHARMRISDVFDPEIMREDPSLEIELLQHLKVACACLDDRHWRRPTMIQVMAMFKEIQAGSWLDSYVNHPHGGGC
ncbi:leucine-rich receptor-like protein kinase family protein [Actinidia rufa]|uniref:non-specific serine/threonine protein kinase n=1 Tax=Actinidia rufa TaxID=165716 RepID=A0A7J0E2R1_9ERIC|nr:leucine-rich receptor-like protein kinase family protein [Actinidia rufa]